MMHLVRDVASEVAAAGPSSPSSPPTTCAPFKTDRQIPTALAAMELIRTSSSLARLLGLTDCSPNFRNTLWSCNWYDITGFAFNPLRPLETFDTPVAVSDGYGDNIRFADRDPKASSSSSTCSSSASSAACASTGWRNNTYRGKPAPDKKDLMPA